MPELPDHNTVDTSAEPSGVRVQHLTFKRDPATIAKMTEAYRQLHEAGENRRLDQIYARRQMQRTRYDRALEPVVVIYPEPTGNSLQDFYNRSQAERKAHDQRQINAGIRYRYEHNLPY